VSCLNIREVGLADQPLCENIPGHDPQRVFVRFDGAHSLLKLLYDGQLKVTLRNAHDIIMRSPSSQIKF
jgi:hypothetical protein